MIVSGILSGDLIGFFISSAFHCKITASFAYSCIWLKMLTSASRSPDVPRCSLVSSKLSEYRNLFIVDPLRFDWTFELGLYLLARKLDCPPGFGESVLRSSFVAVLLSDLLVFPSSCSDRGGRECFGCCAGVGGLVGGGDCLGVFVLDFGCCCFVVFFCWGSGGGGGGDLVSDAVTCS